MDVRRRPEAEEGSTSREGAPSEAATNPFASAASLDQSVVSNPHESGSFNQMGSMESFPSDPYNRCLRRPPPPCARELATCIPPVEAVWRW